MRGFQPGKARAVPQNYADGGVVSTIKGMLGFGKKKPEPLPADLNKMPPTGAGPAASQPEPPKKAISQYSGMSALERRMKEADAYADGGLVRGPGTGISDDIEDEVEDGTFIMPADSTEAMGEETMEKLGKAKVPVNLSNGEAKLPPEALQAIGAEVMEAIKNVTHTPAAVQAQGFPGAQESAATRNFADGGVVRKEERPRTLADLARSPGYGAGAGGPVATPPARAQAQPKPAPAPAAPPVASQPVPGVTRQGNSYTATTVADRAQSPAFGFGAAKVDTSGMTPIPTAPAARPATQISGVQRDGNSFSAAPAQPRQPSPYVQAAIQSARSTPADRVRTAGFSVGAGQAPATSTTPPRATPSPAVTQAPPSARTTPTAQARTAAPKPNPLDSDPQVQADRAALSKGWNTVLDVSDDAGRAISDIATLVPRGLAGAYDSVVVRPMRAAGIKADYLSQFMVPDGVDPASMTPFTDQKRMAQAAQASQAAPAAASKVPPKTAADTKTPPAGTTTTTTAAPPANTTTAPKPDAQKTSGPQATEPIPGVFRVGNSYGDSAQAAVDGARPSAGPSARNMEAMNNLVARDPVAGAMDRALGREQAPSVRGMPQAPGQAPAPRASTASPATAAQAAASTSTPPVTRGFPAASQPTDVMGIYSRASDALKGVADAQRALDDYGPRMSGGGDLLKGGRSSQQQFQQDSLRTSLVQQAQKGGRGAAAAMQALNAMDANQAGIQVAQMREQGDTQRAGMREAGDSARFNARERGDMTRAGMANDIARERLGLDRTAQGFQTRAMQRQEQLQADYDAADTPEKRAAIAQKIRDMSGKQQDMRDNFMVVGGGQEWDAAAGAMRNVPQRLVDLRTVQDVGATGQGGKPLPVPADPKERKVGTVYVAPNGANVRWTGQGWQQA